MKPIQKYVQANNLPSPSARLSLCYLIRDVDEKLFCQNRAKVFQLEEESCSVKIIQQVSFVNATLTIKAHS